MARSIKKMIRFNKIRYNKFLLNKIRYNKFLLNKIRYNKFLFNKIRYNKLLFNKIRLNNDFWEILECSHRESQNMWWLTEIVADGKKVTQLEDALKKGRSFKKDELLAPNKWLTPKIYRTYVRRVVAIMQKFKNKNMTLDGDTDQAFEELQEEHRQINESSENLDGHRKQHTAYIANRIKLGKERGESWESYKQLANDSIGKQQVELPGNGKIYLRRVRKDPEQEILYSHEAFDHDETENLPVGVLLLKKTAFDTAWTYIAKKGNIKET